MREKVDEELLKVRACNVGIGGRADIVLVGKDDDVLIFHSYYEISIVTLSNLFK